MTKKKSKTSSKVENPYKTKLAKDSGTKKMNPFEMHINKAKFTVLGQKSKDDWGLPGISRAKANKTRELTLLPEYKERHKSNVFKDKRIGENNTAMDPDKKMLLRMAAEKRHQLSKKSIFNLNEDEELTHGGRALMDDNMKDDLSDDSDQEDFLDAKFVQEKHFGGGGFLTKSTSDGPIGPGISKTRKELIDDIIADSKKKKYESKKEKADQEEAVSSLNAKYGDFLSLMSGKTLTEDDKDKSKKECEFRDYDILVRTLMIERDRKAPATDRLKTSEELATEEKEKLEKLEEARSRRMRGEVQESSGGGVGRSGDSLDDGFALEKNHSKLSVSYSEGKMNEFGEGFENRSKLSGKKSFQYDTDETPKSQTGPGDSDESDPEEGNFLEGDSDGDSNEDSEEDKYSDILEESDCEGKEESDVEQLEDGVGEDSKESEVDEKIESLELESDEDSGEDDGNVEERKEHESEEDDNDEEKEEHDDEDNSHEDSSDIEDDSDEGNTEDKITNNNKNHDKRNSSKSTTQSNGEIIQETGKPDTTFLKKKRKSRVKFLDKERIMEEAKKEIPFTFQVPDEYEDFWGLFEGRSTSDVSTILTRMVACNHPKLGGTTQGKSIKIFNYLLQTLHVLCSPDPENFMEDTHPLSYVDTIIPFLFNLVQLSPSATAESLVQVLDEKYKDFCKGNSRKYPFTDTFIFLKVSCLLFPASDAYHRVTTRVIVFLSQILAEAKVKTRRDILGLLFTSSMLFECISKSRRYVGELTNSLKGLIYLSIPSTNDKLKLPYTKPFRRLGVESDLLVLEKPVDNQKPETLETKFTLSSINDENQEIDDQFKIETLNQSLKLLTKLTKTWTNLPSIHEIFKPVNTLIEALNLNNYPTETSGLVTALKKDAESVPRKGKALMKAEGRPTALKMMEPEIENVFYGGKTNNAKLSKAKLETQKLMAKVKREQKGAKRELKRDAQFLAREKLQEERQRDVERKRKVNVIMGGLAMQEHEHKKYKRDK